MTTAPLTPSHTTILSLPPEIHLHLSRSLLYPDLLALKHTHPRFYSLIRTTIYDRVDWLLERPQQGLPLPQTKCIMKTDEQFCNHAEIRRFMQRRRRHEDCVGVCFVVEGTVCEGVVTRALRGSGRGRRLGKGTYRIAGIAMAFFALVVAFVMMWLC